MLALIPAMPDPVWTPLARVGGSSMEPALHPGDLVATRPALGRVVRGDVVLVAVSGRRYVKRVVGTAGDLVEMEAGRLRVDGRWVDPPPRSPGARVRRWIVPPGHLFLAGDHRAGSDDSRSWATPFIPVRHVLGVVLGGSTRSHPAWS